MDDPVPYKDRFILIGSEDSSWDSCFILGHLQLGVDKYSGNLQGAYDVTYSQENWEYVYLWGEFESTPNKK